MNETVDIVRVETDDELDAAIKRICEAAGNLTVVRAGDGLHYLPWETEYGDTWAIRPCTEDEYDREQCDGAGDGHLYVDFSLRPSRLPLADVTAYGQGHPTPWQPMGEAGVVVHRWLEQHPDVIDTARESVSS